jgi:hypothetical protein
MWVFREVIGALYAAFRQQTNNYITNSMSSGSEQPQSLNFALKAKYAFYATLIFFLVASPETYRTTQDVLGWLFTITTHEGAPTPLGFFFHTFGFFLILWGAMLFPRDT